MKKQYGILLLACSALVEGALFACGGVDSPAAVGTSAAALSCRSDSDCGSGYSCAREADHSICKAPDAGTKQSPHTCSRNSDCASGYTCATDVRTPYCRAVPAATTPAGSLCRTADDCSAGAECERDDGDSHCVPPHRSDAPSGSPDAGAPYYAESEDCHDHGESCTPSTSCDGVDAGTSCSREVEHGDDDSYYSEGDGSDGDHSGPGRGGDDGERR